MGIADGDELEHLIVRYYDRMVFAFIVTDKEMEVFYAQLKVLYPLTGGAYEDEVGNGRDELALTFMFLVLFYCIPHGNKTFYVLLLQECLDLKFSAISGTHGKPQ